MSDRDMRKQRAKELRERTRSAEYMLRMCIYGAAVTLIGGIILGACAVTMVR